MKVQNKTFIVTGGANGMGREIVLLLLNKGAKVAAADRHETALQETARLAGEKIMNLSIHVLDITDKAAVDRFPDQVIARFGTIDGIINNAGIIQPFVKVNDLTIEAIEKVMNVNFYGTLFITKTFLPYLLQRPEAHIVNISSMGGFLPVPGQSAYGASKAAVKLLTEGLYAELLTTNVKVSVVFPGAVNTNISANSGVKIKTNSNQQSSYKMISPEKAAKIIIEGMENNRLYIYAGSDSSFLNFLYRLSPGYATRFISKKMQSLLKN